MGKFVRVISATVLVGICMGTSHAQEAKPAPETPLVEKDVEAPIAAPDENSVVDTGEPIDLLFEKTAQGHQAANRKSNRRHDLA